MLINFLIHDLFIIPSKRPKNFYFPVADACLCNGQESENERSSHYM